MLDNVVGQDSFKKYSMPNPKNPSEVFESCKSCKEYCVGANAFCLCKKIGEGAYGVIYKCSLRGRTVAAKKLKDHVLIQRRESDSLPEAKKHHGAIQAYQDLVVELAVLSSMGKHPNVVEFYGACIADETNPVIFEEFVSGPNISNLYSKKGTSEPFVPPRSAIYSWIMDMMRGLEFLHDRDPQIIHRDLKPGNLLLTKDLTRLKIADFGMCKIVNKGCSAAGVGNTGTEAYMAPEVFHKDQTQYTEKVDIYSASVIMWFIATGQGRLIHFRGEDTSWRPDIQWVEWEELKAVIQDSWVQQPELRPSAAQIIKRLNSFSEIPPPISPLDFGTPGCGCSVM